MVGEMASVNRCELWKTGEEGLCCSSSAIETLPGPSSLLEERIKTPILCVVVFFVLSATSQTGGNGKGIWINRDEINLMHLAYFVMLHRIHMPLHTIETQIISR